jgi:hypothetical protein
MVRYSGWLAGLVCALAVALGAGVFFAGEATAAGSACTTTWTGGGGDSDWDTSLNWTGGVPSSGSVACITLAGAVVNARSGGDTAGSIEVGGATGTSTLHVWGQPFSHHGLLTLTNQDPALGIEAHGELILGELHYDNQNNPLGTHGTVVVSGGTLTNRGTIYSAVTLNSPNTLTGSLDNKGTLKVDEDLTSAATSVWTTSGALSIASGKSVTLIWNGSSSFTQTAGTITDTGAFDQQGGSFVASGTGTQTGNPLQFDGGVTISPSGTGSGVFELRSGADVLGSDIAAGYTLRVAGRKDSHHGLLTLNESRTNNGTILLGSVDGTHGVIAVASGKTLTNKATITSTPTAPGSGTNGPNTVTGNLDNQGTLTVNEDLTSGAPSVWTTSGTLTIASGKSVTLSWNGLSSFTQTAGSITDTGSFDQQGGSFVASGSGTQTGNPLQFDGGVTISPSGTGSGAFELRSGGDVLGSDIASGYTLRVAGRPNAHHGLLTLNESRTNNGTILLGSVDGTHGVISVASGKTLTNKATITSTPTAPNGGTNGPNTVTGNLDNQGTLGVDEDLTSGAPSVWTTSGTVTTAGGKTLTLGWDGSSSLTQTGGTITNSGKLIQNQGTFTANGSGTETGNPLEFDGVVHINPSGTGSGALHVRSGGDVLDSDIGAGYTVLVGGDPGAHHGLLLVPASQTNHGTIVLGTGDSTHGVLQMQNGAVLANAGTLRADLTGANQTSNGPDTLVGAVTNTGTITLNENLNGSGAVTSSGHVTVNDADDFALQSFTQTGGTTTLNGSGSLTLPSGSVALQGGTLQGTGTVHASVSNTGGTLHPGNSPGILTISVNYTQGPSGSLAIDVSGPTQGSGYSHLTVTGTAAIAGTLHTSTSGAFEAGPLRILDAASLSGKFSKLTFAGESYAPSYDATGVTLTGRKPCVVPKVVGKQLAPAKTAIVKAHCAVGPVTKKKAPGRAGRVLSEHPAAGAHRPSGFKVSLVVSKH